MLRQYCTAVKTKQLKILTLIMFQTYLPMVTKADAVAKALPRLEEKIYKLQEDAVNKCNDSSKTFINIVKTKYEHLLKWIFISPVI